MFSLTYGTSPAVYYYYYYYYYYQQLTPIHFLTLNLKSTQHIQYTHMAIPEYQNLAYGLTRIPEFGIWPYQNLAPEVTGLLPFQMFSSSAESIDERHISRPPASLRILEKGKCGLYLWKHSSNVKFRELLVVWVVCVMCCVNKPFVVEHFVHECFVVEPN